MFSRGGGEGPSRTSGVVDDVAAGRSGLGRGCRGDGGGIEGTGGKDVAEVGVRWSVCGGGSG